VAGGAAGRIAISNASARVCFILMVMDVQVLEVLFFFPVTRREMEREL
jgi:hypothetical protein